MRDRTLKLKESIGPFLFVLVIALSLLGTIEIPTEFTDRIAENTPMSALTLAGLMFLATVIAPLTLLPVIPLVSPYLGPFVTGLACWAGWTLGAVSAFWIARHGGRPIIRRFVNLTRLEQYESRIPKEAHFPLVLALRLVLPVDLLSYGLGLFTTIPLRTYTIASGLGILWFSFAFSYIGYAAHTGSTVLFLTYGVASLIIFGTAAWYVQKTLKK